MKKETKVMAWALVDNETGKIVREDGEVFPLLYSSRAKAYKKRKAWESVVKAEIKVKAQKR